jgi:integrase
MRFRKERYKSGEKALTRKEYDKLLAVIDNIEDEVLIKLAVSTGLRREDLTALKIADIDFDQGRLTFYEAKKRRNRTIDIEPAVVLLIRKFLKTFEKRELLFSFTGRTAYNHLNHWCVIANIPTRPFHALRATCVKFGQQAGRSPEAMAKLLGDTMEVIQIHYSTPSADEMAEDAKERPIA